MNVPGFFLIKSLHQVVGAPRLIDTRKEFTDPGVQGSPGEWLGHVLNPAQALERGLSLNYTPSLEFLVVQGIPSPHCLD